MPKNQVFGQAGGVDTNRAGWYFIKKTGMVKFVEIGKKGINNTADA